MSRPYEYEDVVDIKQKASASHVSTERLCTLCQVPVSKHPIVDGDNSFCCPGCHAVYNILKIREELDGFEANPLFEQALRSGLISNPALLAKIEQQHAQDRANEERQRIHLEITDLWCPSCAHVIKWLLLQARGVRHCVVDYATDMAVIEFCPREISKDKVVETIAKLGYHAVDLHDPSQRKVARSLLLRLFVALFCSLNVMMLAYPLYANYFTEDASGYSSVFVWLSFVLALPVVTYCAWPLWRRAYTASRAGIYGMEALVCMAVTAAMGYSSYQLIQGSQHVYFDSMSVVVTFVLLGRVIEAKAKFSAKETLMRLARAAPKRARRRGADGNEAFVLLKEVSIGDHLVVIAGERITLEGVVVEGRGSVDESAMTGEALPAAKEEGSEVLSGTLLQQGRLVIRVTATQEMSLLHRIVALAEQDLQHKAIIQRAVDAIARWFVPAVLLVAVGTIVVTVALGIAATDQTVWGTALLRAVSVLLISCPCAIGIAAPLVESLLMGKLAERGAIIRNRGCLQHLGNEDAVVFDKTGTVTEGIFAVTGGLESLSDHDKAALKGLVKHSIHPIAQAVDSSLLVAATPCHDVEELIGRGLRGQVDGVTYLFGSATLMQLSGVEVPTQLHSPTTEVFFAANGRLIARLQLDDRIKPGMQELVSAMKPARAALVSGDSKPAVEAVAKACHFQTWEGGCSPLDKRAYIEDLRNQGEIVAFVGDGINDALALSAAHVGISVVSATDISIQVSDVLLTTPRLEVLGDLRRLGRQARRIIRQNLFWAFSYNVVGIGLAVMGALTPIYAAIAMICSSLIVSANALRLK